MQAKTRYGSNGQIMARYLMENVLKINLLELMLALLVFVIVTG